MTARPYFDLEGLELIHGPPPVILSQADFRGYQRWMARMILRLPAVFLAAEMGLGKTAATLWAIRTLLDIGEVTRVLVVAPLKVAEITWPEEIAKWSFARSLRYSVVTGTHDERVAALRLPADIYIINRENVVWLEKHLGARRWTFDMLVYDEASRLKGGSKRTKGNVRKDGTQMPKRRSEFGTLNIMRYTFKKVVELSGTPAPNGCIDLWGPMYLIDKGQRLGTSISAFRDRWFKLKRSGYGYEAHDWSEGEIMSRISDVFFSLKEADYLEVPPLVPVDHWVTLPPKAREIYRRMQRQMILPEFDVEAVNNGVLTNKLLQLANGSIYSADGSSVRVHDEKLGALESIIAEAMGQPILLAYEFRFDREAITKRFPFVRWFGDTKNDKRDWDAGRIKVMGTHPASAGHGLNLQLGGNIEVWYGLTWSLELYLQFIKRLARSGQMADRVFLHRILARDTADESMVKLLDVKGITQDRITDAVKADVAEEQWRMAA